MKRLIAIPMAILAVLMLSGLSFSAGTTSNGQNSFPNRDDQSIISINHNVEVQGHYGLAPAWSGDRGDVAATNSGNDFFPNRDDQNLLSITSKSADQGHYGVAPAWSRDRGNVANTNSGNDFFPNRDDQNLEM